MRERIIYKVSKISILANILLSAVKVFMGIISNSSALISDAIHSLSDVISTFVVIIGTKLASKDDDSEHNYGHDRFECVASIILSMILLFVAFILIINSIGKLNSNIEYNKPMSIGIYATILSIVVKELMYWYTRHYALKIESSLLLADAWHHRSDALSSVGAFIGILLEQFNIKYADTYATIVISLFILKVAYDIFKDAIEKMVDKACDNDTIASMTRLVNEISGVERIDLLKTRVFGSKIYVDIEIAADGEMTLREAHTIAENVHDTLEKEFNNIKHCMVHVNSI